MKPLVVLGGPIHPDGMKQLETEVRVVVTSAETEAGMIAAAKEAEGILFRSKPDCTRSLMAACPKLKVVGRHGVGLDIVRPSFTLPKQAESANELATIAGRSRRGLSFLGIPERVSVMAGGAV